MGIKGLGKFLAEYAPAAVRQKEIGSFIGQTIAVDASMSLYQFMIAIRDAENFGNLTNESGEVTSHISGFLSRAIRLLEHGIKPVYVFDGEPLKLKSGELAKRSERRAKAEADLAVAQELGDKEEIKKFMGRTVRVTKKHNDDVKELLRLMGIPIIEAPTEAEAQCAHLAKSGVVYATATEDADALTFGSPVLVRHLNFADQKTRGKPILTFTLQTILNDLKLTMPQFIDFCILCGCDYCDRLKGIGPQTAYKLIQKHGSIENVLASLDKTQHPVPEDFNFVEAREFFVNPTVIPATGLPKLIWKDPQEEELRRFLVEVHNFNPTRVENYLNRLRASKSSSSQTRLESFFGPVKMKPKDTSVKTEVKKKTGTKRKNDVTSLRGGKKAKSNP